MKKPCIFEHGTRGKVIRMECSLTDVSRRLQKHLNMTEHMDTVRMLTPEGRHVLHARARLSGLRRCIGLDRRIVVTLEETGDGLCRMTITHPAVADKIAASAVSLLGIWPLAVAAAAGMISQIMLCIRLNKVFLRQDARFAEHTAACYNDTRR